MEYETKVNDVGVGNVDAAAMAASIAPPSKKNSNSAVGKDGYDDTQSSSKSDKQPNQESPKPAGQTDGSFQILMNTLTGGRTLNCTPGMKVIEVKALLAKQDRRSVNHYRLFFAGEKLENDQHTLAQCGVTPECRRLTMFRDTNRRRGSCYSSDV
jgi:hypothetical protein